MADTYDVIVIGTGPGGYVAAIRAAQLGLKTAVVERDDVVGGRCLNYACIPAKTLLRAAELLDEARNGAEQGVIAKDVSIDFPKLHERRESVRKTLTGGVAGLFKKNKIDLIEGEGSLTEGGDVKVGDTTYETKNVILATGSVALPIPGTEFGGRILDTWGAWSLDEMPKSIAVVGAGASGSEIASAYVRFGVEVKLIEMLDQILPAEDKDVVRIVERTFKKQGIEVLTGAKVENVEAGADSVKFSAGGADHEVDYMFIAAWARPRRRGAPGQPRGGGVAAIGDNGNIDVDGYQQTSTESIYAIGDITPGPAPRMKAMEEGSSSPRRSAEGPLDTLDLIACRHLRHPHASVGLTEAQAKEATMRIKTMGKFKLGGPRARCTTIATAWPSPSSTWHGEISAPASSATGPAT